MSNFLNIRTVFNDVNSRTIDSLKKAYTDSAYLEDIIYSLVKGELIEKKLITGKRILIKPNWVLHNRKPDDEWCLRTHQSLIFAFLEIILKENPSQVIIGDAPIQGCEWEKMHPERFYTTISNLSNKYSIPIIIKDFRRVTFNPDKNNPVKERNPISDYIIFDVGKASYLEPISVANKNIFRVTNYNPDRLALSHTKGMHKYCITRELFEADVVISMPKLKTHQKTGITAALKNLVGVNGDKDYLPHHRKGGTGFGGDCYPGKNYLRYWAETALDNANRKQGKSLYWFWSTMSAVLWKLSNPQKVHERAAAWYGNDTTWRMVYDLNRVALYGKRDGTLSDEPQRKLFSLGDGIIGGQGDGPLRPGILPLGVVTFTNNSALHDVATGLLMGFNIGKIPMLKTASEFIKETNYDISINGEFSILEDLTKLSAETLPPPGWVDYLAKNQPQ